MKVNVRIELDYGKINALREAAKRALDLTSRAVLSDILMSGSVPHESGTLEGSGYSKIDVEKMVAKIIFDTPYARRLYWHPEYNFRTDKNPFAGGLWMHPYIDGEKADFVEEKFAEFWKQESGGLIH